MWTRTTTITNNKNRFITVITPLIRFAIRTASADTINHWMRNGILVSNKLIKNNANQQPFKKP